LTFATIFTAANAQNQKCIKFINKTGLTVSSVFITPHDANKWSRNLLSAGKIENNEAYQILLPRTNTTRYWDIKVFDNKNNAYHINNVDISDMSSAVAIKEGSKITVESAKQYQKDKSTGGV